MSTTRVRFFSAASLLLMPEVTTIFPGSKVGMTGMKSRGTSMLDFSATGDANTLATNTVVKMVEENFMLKDRL